jgi:hypothetical protein
VTSLIQRFPPGPDTAVDELLNELSGEPPDGWLVTGDERMAEFLVAFARRLLAPPVARRYPELASLGFFLRRSELNSAVGRLGLHQPRRLRFPRGLVFHVPPANVDTVFVYSWALSALAGNRNVVRVSPRADGAAAATLEVLAATLVDAHPAVAATQRMVTYGRDEAVTAALSAACQLRVIWGGDRSVSDIRRCSLDPAARDLVFPDRSSFAVVSANGWVGASAAQRRAVVDGFYNDAYWFDQAACASPRALYWVGDVPIVERAQAEFVDLLDEVVTAKRPRIDPAMAVEKLVATYGLAAEDTATSVRFRGNAVAIVDLAHPALLPRRWLGAGTFPQSRVDALVDLVAVVQPRDQTVTHFGFAELELVAFARAVGRRGVDRLVPIGQALTFAPIWDGYDLLAEFTRITTVAV